MQEGNDRVLEDFVDSARQVRFSEESINYAVRVADFIKSTRRTNTLEETDFYRLMRLTGKSEQSLLINSIQEQINMFNERYDITPKKTRFEKGDLVKIKYDKMDFGIILDKKISLFPPGNRYVVGLICPGKVGGENMDLIWLKVSFSKRSLEPLDNSRDLERVESLFFYSG